MLAQHPVEAPLAKATGSQRARELLMRITQAYFQGRGVESEYGGNTGRKTDFSFLPFCCLVFLLASRFLETLVLVQCGW